MDNIKSYGDPRLKQWCLYCRGNITTREHVPSKVFLDEPYPDNLPIVGACAACNTGFSLDEEYLACLIDCVLAGDCDPEAVSRPKIARILDKKPALREMLRHARQNVDGALSFTIDYPRVRNVLLKLARGHVMFELDTPLPESSASVEWTSLELMTTEDRARFETPPPSLTIHEAGSRSSQKWSVVSVTLESVADPKNKIIHEMLFAPGWEEVQPERYRYLAVMTDTGHTIVRIVLSEFLACEIIWSPD